MDFRVDLTTFRGPLDLLLYLVRKHEVDVANIPIAEVTDQFLKYIEVLEQLDVDDVGDFIEMASTLLEMKSRLVLPSDDEETEELDDAREDLVQRLLEYKKYKDAAGAVADGTTVGRARRLGLSAAEHLAQNDSYPFFQARHDLLMTGPTNTNVMDVRLLLVR